MPRRNTYADALARLLFAKPLQDLTPQQRAELDVLRAIDGDQADEERYEQLAEWQDESEGQTLH
jgi:hypothetical protein